MCGKLRKRQKGSYTLEAALLSCVWLTIVFSSLLLLLGTIEKGYLCGQAWEKAVFSAAKLVREETMEVQGITVEKDCVTASYQKQLRIPFVKETWNLEGSVKRKIIRPVVFIEKIRKLKMLKEGSYAYRL